MKKLIALLLVLCMVFGLVACAKPDSGKDSTGGTTAGNSSKPTTGATVGNHDIIQGDATLANGIVNPEIKNNDDLIKPDVYGGKTLQLYGFSSAAFEDIEEMGMGSFIWMMRAAVDEWATLNNVTIVYEGDYDQNTMLGAINSGAKPDLLLHGDKFPISANVGIVRALTDEEYNQLAETCGTKFLDMLNYKGKSYGFNYPWSGNCLFYYNKTMFEEYGVKTPKEYYMEGNWTWDTMEKCWEEITKDLDGDGKKDTYGSGQYGSLVFPYTLKEDDNGRLIGLMGTSEEYGRMMEIEYKGKHETGALGQYMDCTVATNPRPGTHVGDAEWYNYAHLNQTLVNGDVIETIMIPYPSADTTERNIQFTQAFMSILTSCDEPEATLDLMTYILRVGMRYMDEFSLGLFQCNYEGMRGASEYSAGWKENFAYVIEERVAEFEAIEDWDQEMYEKMVADIFAAKGFIGRSYAGYSVSLSKDEGALPPASKRPLLVAAQQAAVDKYNNLYAN